MGEIFTLIDAKAFAGIDNDGNCPTCTANIPTHSKKWALYIQTLNGKTITLNVSPHLEIYKMKKLIYDKHGISPTIQRLVFAGNELLDGDNLSDCKLHDQDILHLITKTKGIASKQMHYNCKTGKIVIGREHGIFGKTIEISSYHVSCRSDQINGQNMIGVVLYSYDNQTDWRLNGVHCKSGYIILKTADKLKNIDNSQGMWHGKCYKSVFGEDINYRKVVGAGFSFKDNGWEFNSKSFNKNKSRYHDKKKGMHKLERCCILAAVENWKQGIRNTKCSAIRNKYKGYCKIHYFY